MKKNITVIGDGGWGTALATLLGKNGHNVKLWGAFPDQVENIRVTRENTTFLPGIKIPENISLTHKVEEAARHADIAVMAVPTRFAGSVLKKFADFIDQKCVVVSVSKGFDPETQSRMSVLAKNILQPAAVCALSGPSHAEEVARGLPTAVVAACEKHETAVQIQSVFMNENFRVYSSNDITGVELGGALKNVIALAAGISDGLGLGDNSKAAIITRGLAEITRLGCALGADAATFAGLSGMGDLIVTCASRHSRNRSVGERLGKGETIEEITAGMKQVAEGVSNCATAKMLADSHGVKAPIIEEMQAIINEHKNPVDAMSSLMTRVARPEKD